jgi:hypothetical protein
MREQLSLEERCGRLKPQCIHGQLRKDCLLCRSDALRGRVYRRRSRWQVPG